MTDRKTDAKERLGTLLGRLRRRAHRAVAVGVGLAVAAAGLGYGAVVGVRALRTPQGGAPATSPTVAPAVRPTASSPIPTPPSEVPVPAPPRSGRVRLVTRLEGPVTAVAAGDRAVYALYAPNPVAGQPQVVARLGLRTGTVTRSVPLQGAWRLALAAGWLWVSGGGSSTTQAGMRSLYRLDPATLAVRGRVRLPLAPAALAVSRAGLWVGAGKRLYRLDPWDGRVLARVTLGGEAGELAADPTGHLLYVATSVPGEATPLPITERDAATGALLATSAPLSGLAVNRLAATARGVWVSIATGLLAGVVLLQARDLRQAALFSPRGGEAGSNATGADVARGVLWVVDGMAGRIFCADPATGKLRAEVPVPQALAGGGWGFSNVVAGGAAWYLGTAAGIAQITPGPRCRP
jgi:hypothetical protein